ncbi:MAG: hypothetical protein ACI35O_02600 [Bacillaceae bacterium]
MKKNLLISTIVLSMSTIGIIGCSNPKQVKLEDTVEDTYNIEVDSPNLKRHLSNWLYQNSVKEILDIVKLDSSNTTIVFVTLDNDAEGYIVMKQGKNNKYKIQSANFVTYQESNWVNDDIISTNEGPYAIFFGENANGKIKAIEAIPYVINEETEEVTTKTTNLYTFSNDVIKLKVPQAKRFMLTAKLPSDIGSNAFLDVAWLDSNLETLLPTLKEISTEID